MSSANNFLLSSFISQEDFERHVINTVKAYNNSLKSIDLKKFNANVIDPIKLLFDKSVFNRSYAEIINQEIHRQRDKSNNNSIGYFHQNIFRYIQNCEVPDAGWDVIVHNGEQTYYVEMKNKHNTMNSSSAAKTYMRMQQHLLTAEDKDTSVCALVEIIAQRSQNIPWIISIDHVRQTGIPQIRRISIDQFYAIVTGENDAFYKICLQLPITLKKVLYDSNELTLPADSVWEELTENLNGEHDQHNQQEVLFELYHLAFSTYLGFSGKFS